MKKKTIICNVLIAVNAFLYFFLAIWILVVVAFSIDSSQNSTAEIIKEANRQGYICFATYLLLIGTSVLYLIYRFVINFLICSNKLEEKERKSIQKVTFFLSIVNILDVLLIMVMPIILTVTWNRINLMDGSYFLIYIFPWLVPLFFSVYYTIP